MFVSKSLSIHTYTDTFRRGPKYEFEIVGSNQLTMNKESESKPKGYTTNAQGIMLSAYDLKKNTHTNERTNEIKKK